MVDVYPFMQQICRVLGMEFEVVDMRWVIEIIYIFLIVFFRTLIYILYVHNRELGMLQAGATIPLRCV